MQRVNINFAINIFTKKYLISKDESKGKRRGEK